MQVETADKYVVFAFRDGAPVFVEDWSGGPSLADSLLAAGAITREQYGDIVVQMTDNLVANEDLVFGEQAVKLGYVRPDQVQAEMSERVRAKIIQALSYTDCRVEIDEAPDALVGMGEYPQELGPLVYVGVRTFYDEALLAKLVPSPAQLYMRLTRPTSAIIAFFALDEDEARLLRALDPQSPVAGLIRSSILDPEHALQLIGLLHFAGLAELSKTRFVATPDPERSGVRSASEVMGPTRGTRTASSHAMPAVIPRNDAPTAGWPGSQSRMPAVTPSPGGRPGSQSRMPAVDPRRESTRPAPNTGFVVACEESGPLARTRSERPRREEPAAAAPTPAPTAVISRAARPGVPSTAQPPASVVAPEADTAAQALAEAKARAGRPRRPPGAGAVHRLGQELERMRAQATPPSAAPAAADNASYAKTHLQQLLMKRRQAGGQVSQPVATKREATHDFKQAQDLLRDLHFARAEELLRGLVEQTPDNDVFRLYHLWAKFRSVPDLETEHRVAMRDLAKKLSQDEAQAPFAAYALAHLTLSDKKDDLAEKLFRKALSLDKNNKDAERHVLILERRKQLTATAEAQSNRKIFGISIAGASKDKE
ncbi:MAG TPA: hypothetical protein VF331_22225 [Polyangiales bacterium]